MVYRTKTYIAADWDNDHDAVQKLHDWNDSDYWNLHFNDAHDLTQSRDSSLYCTIKKSLKTRMNASKTFVLIVGTKTSTVTKGGCQYCGRYSSYSGKCNQGYSVDYRSYIKYECDIAVDANIKIVVLYKASWVDKEKCPSALKDKGTHIPMWKKGSDGKYYWNYQAIKNALG